MYLRVLMQRSINGQKAVEGEKIEIRFQRKIRVKALE